MNISQPTRVSEFLELLRSKVENVEVVDIIGSYLECGAWIRLKDVQNKTEILNVASTLLVDFIIATGYPITISFV